MKEATVISITGTPHKSRGCPDYIQGFVQAKDNNGQIYQVDVYINEGEHMPEIGSTITIRDHFVEDGHGYATLM